MPSTLNSTVLITGAGGMLAQALSAELRAAGNEVLKFSRVDLDVTVPQTVNHALRKHQPGLVIQCAAFTKVDEAETNPTAAFKTNAEGAVNVAHACREIGARFVYLSTDYVFDGAASAPYPPDYPPNPINVYGRSKLEGEHGAREAKDYLIVRTSWLYGGGGRNFVQKVVDTLRAGGVMRVVDDQRSSPTWTVDLAATISALLRAAPPPGVYHACNSGTATWYELAREAVALLRLKGRVEPCRTVDYATAAARPAYSVLDCTQTEARIGAIRDWRQALKAAADARSFE